jgi:hypothetical protein
MAISIKHLLSRFAATAITVSAGAAGAAAGAPPGEPTLDATEADDRAGGHALAVALARLPPLEATHRACELALSPARDHRLAIASALEWAFALVGDDLVIDHLASDADAPIRRAAARAAWVRRALGGDPGVLDRLRDDPDPGVREVVALAGRGR